MELYINLFTELFELYMEELKLLDNLNSKRKTAKCNPGFFFFV